jgi:hypothetical protein
MVDHARTRFFFALLALTALGAGVLIYHPRPLLKDDHTRLLEALLAHWRHERIPTIPSPLPDLIPPRRLFAARHAEAPPVVIPDFSGSAAILYTVKPGESLGRIAYRYLAQTIFMTSGELEAAIRQANPAWTGTHLRPGQELIIPGIEPQPIVEHPVPFAKSTEIRAIYLTGLMAGSPRGLEIIKHWKALGGNAIVFDVKDMDGIVSMAFDNPLAPKLRRPYIASLPKFTRFLHRMGLHAIARIALFRDEYIAEHHPELAAHSRRTGEPWRENGKLVWTDPSRREVQDYNLALARQAVASGVDEIQFDYVRFPAEGDQSDAEFHFQSEQPAGTRAEVISNFLKRAYAELHPLGVLVSLDVFGVMAWQRPVDLAHTGQDIVEMARYCDVLSPMVYPSHFFGMDGFARPGDAPEHFISTSMERFRKITEGTGVVLRPWLQAFAWRTKTYSPGYILTQVNISREYGGVGYLFWNARNDYSTPFIAMREMRSAAEAHPPGTEHQPAAAANVPLIVSTTDIPEPADRETASRQISAPAPEPASPSEEVTQ